MVIIPTNFSGLVFSSEEILLANIDYPMFQFGANYLLYNSYHLKNDFQRELIFRYIVNIHHCPFEWFHKTYRISDRGCKEVVIAHNLVDPSQNVFFRILWFTVNHTKFIQLNLNQWTVSSYNSNIQVDDWLALKFSPFDNLSKSIYYSIIDNYGNDLHSWNALNDYLLDKDINNKFVSYMVNNIN